MKAFSLWLAVLFCIAASCAHQSKIKDEAKTVGNSPPPPQTNEAQPISETLVKQTAFPKQEENIATFGDGWRFETEKINKQHTKNKFRAEIEYPRLVSDKNNLNARRFNEAMRKFINEEGGWSLADKCDAEKERHEHWREVEEYFSLNYDVVFASNDFVSIEFGVAAYSWGAAHPVDYSLVFNFDLQQGKLLLVKDIFKSRSKYLSVISNYCQNDLERRLKTENLYAIFTEHLEPKAENFKTIAITREGLKVLLGECNVTPCAAGTQFVVVPFDVLKKMLNPQSPVAKIARGEV